MCRAARALSRACPETEHGKGGAAKALGWLVAGSEDRAAEIAGAGAILPLVAILRQVERDDASRVRMLYVSTPQWNGRPLRVATPRQNNQNTRGVAAMVIADLATGSDARAAEIAAAGAVVPLVKMLEAHTRTDVARKDLAASQRRVTVLRHRPCPYGGGAWRSGPGPGPGSGSVGSGSGSSSSSSGPRSRDVYLRQRVTRRC